MDKFEEATAAKPLRKGTKTSAFGVSKRESHDSSEFYSRFSPPIISDDDEVVRCPVPNTIWNRDSRDMAFLPDKCISLVVTSPPYFVGKEYESSIRNGDAPVDYIGYLRMLTDVFAECFRVLEPGGRIAVNVANLGRKPYRSLSADLMSILQDEVGFLLRGEIVWIKGKGASGNCAWGSFGSASNPVLRDVSERIILASKGSFSRLPNRKTREKLGLPHVDTISKEDFMAWTLDTWYFQPESAKKVGHPAPFPVELPRRLIELNTYSGDTVLDPFMGGGQTAIACSMTGRNYVGVEIDGDYVALANERVKSFTDRA